MNPYMRRWIDALRSGDYKQAQQQLRWGAVGYCCLGVACDVLKDDIGGDWCGDAFAVNEKFFSTQLPPIITGLLKGGSSKQFLQAHLIKMNDLDGSSFDEIADYLEKRYT